MVRFKFNIVTKISLTALFTAFVIIFTKLLAIQNIGAMPYIRISLGPSFIVFAGMMLGPIFGGITGLLSDVIGFFAFDTTGFGYNPLLSITYMLYGVFGGLLVYLFIKNKKIKFPIFQTIILLILNILVISFFANNNSITLYKVTYELTDPIKIGVIVGSLVISLLYLSLYYLIYETLEDDKEKILLNNISGIIFIIFLVNQIFSGSLIKSLMFEVNFVFLFSSQIIASIVEMIIGSYIVFVSYLVLKKSLKKFVRKEKDE